MFLLEMIAAMGLGVFVGWIIWGGADYDGE